MLNTFNVKDFPSAFAARDALQAAGGGTLYFPAGTYAFTDRLTINNVPCSILGDGETSILVWKSRPGGIRYIGGPRDKTPLTVSMLRLETELNYGGIALDLSWGPGEKMKCCSITNVRIQPVSRSSDLMWTIGVRLKNATDVVMIGVSIYGSTPGVTQTIHQNYGIVIDSDVASAGYQLTHSTVDNYRTAVSVRQCEGFYCSSTEIFCCRVAYDFNRVIGAEVSGGHIDYVRHAFVVTQSSHINIHNAVWIKNHGIIKSGDAFRFIDYSTEVNARSGNIVTGLSDDAVVNDPGRVGDPDVPCHLPRYFGDPNLKGCDTLMISNCPINCGRELAENDASGIVLEPHEIRVGSVWNSYSEFLTASNIIISGFPGKGVFFTAGTDGNTLNYVKIENCGVAVEDNGTNNHVRG